MYPDAGGEAMGLGADYRTLFVSLEGRRARKGCAAFIEINCERAIYLKNLFVKQQENIEPEVFNG